jgi:hypothetical protein
MPPKPVAPISRVSQTCGRVSAPSSRRPVADRSAGDAGTKASTSTTVSTDRPATAKNADRQPTCWPSQVAAGTPTTLATDSPSMTAATARPCRPGAASPAATSEATPK